MSKKLFLIGEPGIGKTTILQNVIRKFGDDCAGFYAQEKRENNLRVGFELVTINLPVQSGLLAHINFDTAFTLGRYKVDITALDEIVAGIRPLLNGNKLLIIDEIGPMEAFSKSFREFILDILESSNNVLATIKLAPTTWIDDIKEHYRHIPIKLATTANRNGLPTEIMDYFSKE